MKQKWIEIAEVELFPGKDGLRAVATALKCRRTVQVHQRTDGRMFFCVRVPAPKAVLIAATVKARVSPEGRSTP